jgi:RNA polymerase sigma-70 factor (ECF subfamily)
MAETRVGERVVALGAHDELLGDAVAHVRLRREYHGLRRWLMDVIRHRYGLTAEDCEEVVNDALLAWHRRLSAAGELRNDRAFWARVARSRAIERLRRKSFQTVELSSAEHVGVDPEIDVLVGEREEVSHLRELIGEVLSKRERDVLVLVEHEGLSRAQAAAQFELTPRQVKRTLERARAKLRAGQAELRAQGRCGMLARTIADIQAGRIVSGDPRWRAGVLHLSRCHRCRRLRPSDGGARA